MSKPDYLPKKLKVGWMKATCPECGKEYRCLPGFKPNTCGVFECIYALANRRIQELRDIKKRAKGGKHAN